jgi:hypothetical protein
MPRKIPILDKLPGNFRIQQAVGPRSAHKIGNGNYLLLPSKFDISKKIYIVNGDIVKPIASTISNECERCHAASNIKYCEHFDSYICSSCCRNCPLYRKCPNR